MAFSTLYYTLLNKPFFIDLRRIDAQAVEGEDTVDWQKDCHSHRNKKGGEV